ncbi:alpha/beta hydrolase domain-containing protein [Rubrivivax gelatinosus]|uniref:alpha/beta hydrolase domain-containing protein n=1 Tax=Rubrivivax gelatinosus TaxID=28068 RepID=UPI0006806CA7|nr:alpha/beta hydrolase domain-containing protein [Rubrivivax gelatinosus]MBG6082421.1 hypothetical protein [Rubrivivax gelatinosus]
MSFASRRRPRLQNAAARISLAFAGLVLAAGADARVTRLELVSVQPAFEGRSFGSAGSYEHVVARAYYAVAPGDAKNAGIVDLDAAPRNARGEVEFSADVEILRPREGARGNGRLLYDVPNRGGKLGLALFNDAPYTNSVAKAADAGNGHVFEQGYTVVWSAWQPDVQAGNGRLLLRLPVVPDSRGLSREEAIFDGTANPVTVDLSYPAASLEPSAARLSVRNNEADPRSAPADLRWRYLSPTRIEITRPEGFHLGAIYEFVYPARDSTVAGLGFAAVRDLVSYLREGGAAGGTPAAGQPIRRAYAFGFSQSGRFLRSFVHEGFNVDESERSVFDGVFVHAAGARGVILNQRFAQPGRYSREHEDHLYPADQFPFAWAETRDPVSGRRDGLLRSQGGLPKVVQTDTALEVWQGRASLLASDGAGQPVPIPADVRHYLLAGLPHFPVVGQASAISPVCQYPTNTVFPGAALRALLRDLDEWVAGVQAPPASRFPDAAKGQWRSPDEVPPALSAVPGFTWTGVINRLTAVDQSVVPPREGQPYAVRVPRVDDAGHEIDAIRLPIVEAPRATYLGWNTRRYGYGAPHLCGLAGSRLPLAATRAEREKSGDKRPSVEERYPSPADYLNRVRASAEKLVQERLLLPADAERFVKEAQARGALD